MTEQQRQQQIRAIVERIAESGRQLEAITAQIAAMVELTDSACKELREQHA